MTFKDICGFSAKEIKKMNDEDFYNLDNKVWCIYQNRENEEFFKLSETFLDTERRLLNFMENEDSWRRYKKFLKGLDSL